MLNTGRKITVPTMLFCCPKLRVRFIAERKRCVHVVCAELEREHLRRRSAPVRSGCDNWKMTPTLSVQKGGGGRHCWKKTLLRHSSSLSWVTGPRNLSRLFWPRSTKLRPNGRLVKSVGPLLRCRDKTEVDGVGWVPVRRLVFRQSPAFSILQLELACGDAG